MERMQSSEVAAKGLNSANGLDELGFYTLTKESTVDAARNILGGAAGIITGGKDGGLKGRFKSATRVVEGGLNIIDVPISAVADTTRQLVGPKNQYGTAEENYNITRALGSYRDVEHPVEAVGATVTTLHAATTRLGSDMMRVLRGEGNHQIAI